MEAEQSQPVPVGRPDPGPGEAEEVGQDAGAVFLGEGEDSPVRGGVQDKGDKVCGFPGKCSLDSGQEDRVRGEEGGAGGNRCGN